MSKLVLATRKSPLALAQTEMVAVYLRAQLGVETELLKIVTTGDRQAEWSLEQRGGKGLFTSELEAALQRGAVDFVDKAKSFGIILGRLKVVLDGAKAGADVGAALATSAPDGLSLDDSSARALWRGQRVELTLTEFKVVRLLATRAGRDVSYREIYDVVRGEGFRAGSGEEGYRANVRALVKRIRQKFRAIDTNFEQLENYPGFGYRWADDQRS